MNMEFALQRFLIEKRGKSEKEAQIIIMQDFEKIEKEAKLDGYI